MVIKWKREKGSEIMRREDPFDSRSESELVTKVQTSCRNVALSASENRASRSNDKLDFYVTSANDNGNKIVVLVTEKS